MAKYTQKFHFYDLVQLEGDPRRFKSSGKAIVMGSYYDQFGGGANEKQQFTLLFEDGGEISWFDEDDLTLIEKGQIELFYKWKEEDEEDEYD